MFSKAHTKGPAWLCGEISIDFITSQSAIGVNRRVPISCPYPTRTLSPLEKMGATEVLSLPWHGCIKFGVSGRILSCCFIRGRGNLDMNVWEKPPHSLGAIPFSLPAHGSRLPSPSGVWGGFTPFTLLLHPKGIYCCWSSVQAEHCFGTARPQKQKRGEPDPFRTHPHSQHLSWTTCDATVA